MFDSWKSIFLKTGYGTKLFMH